MHEPKVGDAVAFAEDWNGRITSIITIDGVSNAVIKGEKYEDGYDGNPGDLFIEMKATVPVCNLEPYCDEASNNGEVYFLAKGGK